MHAVKLKKTFTLKSKASNSVVLFLMFLMIFKKIAFVSNHLCVSVILIHVFSALTHSHLELHQTLTSATLILMKIT